MLRKMALLFGLIFIAAGVAGFFLLNPAGPGSTGHSLSMDHGEGMLLGLFPVNTLHNAVHILFGVYALAASRSAGGAQGFFKFLFIAYAFLAILGLIPSTQTLFGYVPLHGNDVYLHLGLALAGLYFGFVHKEGARG